MADKQTETKIVSWHLVAKNLIRFAGDENSYVLADNVLKANDFVKYPLRKGDSVSVDIKDGNVVFLRKAKSESPKSESKGSEEAYEPTPDEEKPKAVAPTPAPEVKKEEVTPSVVGEEKELTVYAIAANKKVVKFLECKDAGWFQIDPFIQAKDYNEIGLIAKNRAKVQIVENRVISFEKMAVEAPQPSQDKPSEAKEGKVEQTPTQAPKKEFKPYNASEASERQTSIECQACMNSACQVVGMVAASLPQAPTANVLNQMIRAVAEANHQLLQELKKK